ncbi:uncharacterized protein LOC129755640 [Uranotaenia lowii]|uniref:uncharacterized protein LOC129755640 n=1 Tax=Uranotaenia lowii TaxID=190385 RepID=UPI00247AB2F6|nr:uncharacterized protein LOC129755640 [Uranotaenia lowii]
MFWFCSWQQKFAAVPLCCCCSGGNHVPTRPAYIRSIRATSTGQRRVFERRRTGERSVEAKDEPRARATLRRTLYPEGGEGWPDTLGGTCCENAGRLSSKTGVRYESSRNKTGRDATSEVVRPSRA